MTSLAQINANRKNAKRSTGPRTTTGKMRSAQNAFQHGLAAALPKLKSENEFIRNLEAALCPRSVDPRQRALAQLIAEQEFAVKQARLIRRALLANDHLRLAARERRARSIPSKKAFRMIRKAQDYYMLNEVQPTPDVGGMINLFELAKLSFFVRALPLSDGFLFLRKRFAAIDRYEQRAISKRNALIRQFVSQGTLNR